MTAMIASLCLYIAFILISAVGTILAIQSLSDSAKYKYRYTTLQRLGVNDSSIFRTIRRQLLIFFFVPVICPVIAGFCMLASMNNVYHIMLESRYTYLLYFISGLAIFFSYTVFTGSRLTSALNEISMRRVRFFWLSRRNFIIIINQEY